MKEQVKDLQEQTAELQKEIAELREEGSGPAEKDSSEDREASPRFVEFMNAVVWSLQCSVRATKTLHSAVCVPSMIKTSMLC